MSSYKYSRLTTDDDDTKESNLTQSKHKHKIRDTSCSYDQDDEVFGEPIRQRVATTGSYDLSKFKENLRRQLQLTPDDKRTRHVSLTHARTGNGAHKKPSTSSSSGMASECLSGDSTDFSDDSSTSDHKKKWTRNQWIMMVILSIFMFVSTVGYSLLSPFFPSEAAKKELSSIETGMIFGFYELVIFLSSPFLGKMVSFTEYLYLEIKPKDGSDSVAFT